MLPAIVSSLVSFAGNFVNLGIVGSIVIVALPCFFLFKIYKEYNEKFGKTSSLLFMHSHLCWKRQDQEDQWIYTIAVVQTAASSAPLLARIEAKPATAAVVLILK